MTGPEIVRVRAIEDEAEGVRTIRFALRRRCSPGQFVMVWLPGVDEIPMSLSYVESLKGVTVKVVGEATRALASVKIGNKLGVRGPYGRGFRVTGGRILVVGGGNGMASLMPAAEAVRDAEKVDIALGARTRSELVFEKRARACSNLVEISTDDGSEGAKGTAVDLASFMIARKKYDLMMSCGPEPMLHLLLDLCVRNGIDCQFSIERFMKCGVGLCGSCAVDGRRVCTDGPVFSRTELDRMAEFGRFKRNEAGARISV